MKILSPGITAQKVNGALKIQTKSHGLPSLSVGEVVEAEILENPSAGNIPILFKNKKTTVYSDLPFKKGEKIAVKVTQLHPKVILRIVSDDIFRGSNVMNALRSFRSNPKMLSSFFMDATAIFNPDNIGEFEPLIGRENIQNINERIASLIFSRESLKNPFFLKNFIHQLGYLFEKEIGEALKNKPGRVLSIKNAGQTLKALLLKISGRLQAQTAGDRFPGSEKLAEFVRSGLTAIETHQGLNYLLQEQEGKYMFQIPLLFPESMGMAEIFVNFNNREDTEKKGRKKQSVLICLDMDALGRIVVETVIEKKKMYCTLKCKDHNIANFISPLLTELGQTLENLGYKLGHLKCSVTTAGVRAKHAVDALQPLFAQDSVDFLV